MERGNVHSAPGMPSRDPGVRIDNGMLTVRQLAALLNVSVATTYRVAKQMHAIRIGRCLRVPADEVRVLLEKSNGSLSTGTGKEAKDEG